MNAPSTFRLMWKYALAVALWTGVCRTHSLASGHQPPRTVTGKVTLATDGLPIPGVNVLLKGTQLGTVTDRQGNYTITVNSPDAVLVFSFIGYTTQEVTVRNQSVVNVSLAENNEVLGEVVVTALGIKREERSLGYSVGTVAGKDMTHVVQENVLSSLTGKVSGVQISQTGGAGSSVSMIIRGLSP